MGINRITSGFLNDQSVFQLNHNLGILSGLQEKISSGRNINRPSDDPVGLTRILDLSNTLRTDDRYGRNIQDAIAEVNTTDKALSNMVDLIHRTQELATQGANFTNNQAGRDAIALEVDQIINQLVQLGNTDINGKYIFSGMKTNTPPFSRAAGTDNIAYAGTPPAQNWQREVEISRGVQLPINVNGDTLLGKAQVVAPAPLPPTFNATSGGLFKTLVELKIDLEAGGDPNQLQQIRLRLDELTTHMSNVAAQQASIGSISNRLELTQGRIDERKSILTKQYAEIQDVDMPRTIADLNHQQNIFEASLSVTARVLQTSLLNFLH
ncbi:MAG TPA: flagellar hook-associated protein FlgL [Coleofasciculaceae cyanobacterium]|jgi:flagellar hook-associated protein 3 FlgL